MASLVDNDSQKGYEAKMDLWEAPFRKKLRILDLAGFSVSDQETCLVLHQLGVDEGEVVEKIQLAPLGDPVSLRIGEQVFTLRGDICRKIRVEVM